MKDILENLLKLLPQPLVVATLATACVYFAAYYHFSDRYRSYGDTFRDEKFRSAAVIIFAIALLYMINRRDSTTAPSADGGVTSATVVLAQIAKDTDDTYRSVLEAAIASRLSRNIGKGIRVARPHAFIGDERSARETLKATNASAIIYDGSVSTIDGANFLCMKLLVGTNTGPLCLAPFKWSEQDPSLDRIANTIAEHVSASVPELANPVIARVRAVEDQLAQIRATAGFPAAPREQEDFPVYTVRHAILVGLDKVSGMDSELGSSKSDATELGKVLREGFGFQTQLLLDSQATTTAITDAIRETAKKVTPNDIFLFYYVGYGSQMPSDEAPTGLSATLIPFDALASPVRTSDIMNEIRKIGCKHKIAIVDTCHATSGLRALPANTAITRPDDAVFYFLGSCGAEQVSMEGKNGFTQVLIGTLRDKDVPSAKGLWIRDIMLGIQPKMNGSQTPQLLRLDGTGDAALVRVERAT